MARVCSAVAEVPHQKVGNNDLGLRLGSGIWLGVGLTLEFECGSFAIAPGCVVLKEKWPSGNAWNRLNEVSRCDRCWCYCSIVMSFTTNAIVQFCLCWLQLLLRRRLVKSLRVLTAAAAAHHPALCHLLPVSAKMQVSLGMSCLPTVTKSRL